MSNMSYIIGDKEYLRNSEGDISFGWVLSGSIVSWSEPDAKDLLISRCWQGMYLYPTRNLQDIEFEKDADHMTGTFGCVCLIHCPIDWNRDGMEDIIAADRRGFLKFVERKGSYPNFSFIDHGYIRDKHTNIPFHIEFYNEDIGKITSEGGYVDPQFYNIIYPLCYPDATGNKKNLIIGDWGGNLWWLPDVSDGNGVVEYEGSVYEKNVEALITAEAKKFVNDLGNKFVKPKERICDADGNPIILGKGIHGNKTFVGSSARIALYWNEKEKVYDIIAITGTKDMNICYLKRVGYDNGKPVFENLGTVDVSGFNTGGLGFSVGMLNIHSKIIIDGKNRDIMITTGSGIVKLRNTADIGEKPVFVKQGTINGKEVITTGYNFTAMFKSKRTDEKYLIDTVGAKYYLRRIVKTNPRILVEGMNIPVSTIKSEVFIPGETDSEAGKSWGFDRLHHWNYNGKDENSFIIGSDAGNLYLLEEDLINESIEPIFTIKGPLKDETGNVIKIYNRVCAVGVSLYRTNGEDLLVGGCSYQMGIALHENPGGGLFIIKNKGTDEKGLPILSVPEPIEMDGIGKKPSLNGMIMMQTYDIDSDGEKEIFLGIREEGYKTHIYKVKNGKIIYTGEDFPMVLTHHYLHDINEDGIVEVIHGGGEQGMAWYTQVKPNK